MPRFNLFISADCIGGLLVKFLYPLVCSLLTALLPAVHSSVHAVSRECGEFSVAVLSGWGSAYFEVRRFPSCGKLKHCLHS